MTELTNDEKEFLLGIVDRSDSDYDDGIDGYPNYSINEDGLLTITFYDPDRPDRPGTYTGHWKLEFIDGGFEEETDG